MDKENKLLDLDRLDYDSFFTKAVPQKIMASDSNPIGHHLYIEQRAYIAKELEEQGYGNIEQAVREFAEKLKLQLYTVEGIDDYQQSYVEEAIDDLIKEKFGN